jgi:hypothetical protein
MRNNTIKLLILAIVLSVMCANVTHAAEAKSEAKSEAEAVAAEAEETVATAEAPGIESSQAHDYLLMGPLAVEPLTELFARYAAPLNPDQDFEPLLQEIERLAMLLDEKAEKWVIIAKQQKLLGKDKNAYQIMRDMKRNLIEALKIFGLSKRQLKRINLYPIEVDESDFASEPTFESDIDSESESD